MVEEKESPTQVYVETLKKTGSNDCVDDDGILLEHDQRASAERRLVKKLDRRLLPTIVVIYIVNYIDVRSTTLGSIICLFMDLDVAISCNISQT